MTIGINGITLCSQITVLWYQLSLEPWLCDFSQKVLDRILSQCNFSAMQTINYTDARNQLASLLETASRDRVPITITRNGTGKAVLLAVEEYESMEATLHLFSTRANANQIQESLTDYEAGKIEEGGLCD